MLKNITFSAEEQIIEAARARARAEKTTLNEKVRSWLENYARDQAESDSVLDRHLQTIARLKGKVVIGRKLTRDELNER
jgi:hypothetical protein